MLDDGNLALETPPDPRRHCHRFYGAYSNRGIVVKVRVEGDSAGASNDSQEERDNPDTSSETRSTWARLVRRIFEADPLTCACGARMRIISFVTDPRVVDRILIGCPLSSSKDQKR